MIEASKRSAPLRWAVALSAAVMLLAARPASALDLSEGFMRLTLHEGIGRFSLSAVKGAPGGVVLPLLAAQDPRTSSLSIVVDTRIYRMGENAEFSETVQKTANGARFVWTASFLSVTEDFSFISSRGSPAADGVRIDITLKNISRQDMTAGIRCLLDTYLGEVGPVHFSTDRQPALKNETTLSGRGLPAWWESPLSGDPDHFGLQCMVTGQGITPPDRIVFANWKRLSDASWTYDTSAARDFSLQPYSVNDSAVSQYYDPRALTPGAQCTVTLVLGRFTPAGFTARPVSAQPAAAAGSVPARPASEFAASVQQSLNAGKAAGTGQDAFRADLSTLNKILAQLDSSLAPGGTAADEDLALMESAIADLKARLSAYGSGK